MIVWHLLEKILFARSVIMFSKNIDRLIAWSEILKNLIFPFQYTGLIIPFMCRPDLMLLSSDNESNYIIGMSPEAFKYCKYYVSPNVTCFDIDNRQIFHNRRDFLQASDTVIINSPNPVYATQAVSSEIPVYLYLPKLKDIESKVRNFPKVRSDQGIKHYAMKIREYFFNFFLNDLLNYKEVSYIDEDLFLTAQRRKKLPKDHYDFIAKFAKTPSFKIFQKRTNQCSTPEARRYNSLLDRFSKRIVEQEETKEDLRDVIDIDTNIIKYNFNELQEKYLMESKFLPIKPIITSHKISDATYYRYTYIPGMLNDLCFNLIRLSKISWPPESYSTIGLGHYRDIFKPNPPYDESNIKDIIWLICWCGSYWYHENDEK